MVFTIHEMRLWTTTVAGYMALKQMLDYYLN